MPRVYRAEDVFTAAVSRMEELYAAGHRVVVSVSGGKDSTCVFEVCRIAAENTGRLPLDVVMRDEEVMFPGTFDYCERMAARPDVRFRWLIANQPVVNAFNRRQPYFWTFDPALEPEAWVRSPPPYAERIPEKVIQGMAHRGRFPADEGRYLVSALGTRAAESPGRRMGIFSSKGFLTDENDWGTRYARPIYDWTDGDVWRAIRDNKWDYNRAYDVMHRLGVPRNRLRIAPPTLTAAAVDHLRMASRAWPSWFDRVIDRLPGVRAAAMFGRRCVEPIRRSGETWEECFWRTCATDAPEWVAARAKATIEHRLGRHRYHTEAPLPQVQDCPRCVPLGSWRKVANAIYMGDPFALKVRSLPYVEPEFFREGAGKWGKGKPTF